MVVAMGSGRQRDVGVALTGPGYCWGEGKDRWESRMTPRLPSLVPWGMSTLSTTTRIQEEDEVLFCAYRWGWTQDHSVRGF